jgi:hypothetical protein
MGLGSYPIEPFFQETAARARMTRLPSVIEAPAQTVHDIELPFARAFDIGQELAKGVVADFMNIERVFLEPWNQVVVDGIQVILVCGGGKVRLLKLDPLLQVGDNVGGNLAGVFLNPEEAALFVACIQARSFSASFLWYRYSPLYLYILYGLPLCTQET